MTYSTDPEGRRREVQQRVIQRQMSGEKPIVVMTSGVFDFLHRGHLNILWRSRQLGDLLIVGVVTDSGCYAYKGRRPAENIQLRIANLRRLGFCDVIEMQHGTDPSALLERFRPDVFTHGDDWEQLLEGQDTIERLGVEFVRLPYTQGVSTTGLRESGLVSEAFGAGPV